MFPAARVQQAARRRRNKRGCQRFAAPPRAPHATPRRQQVGCMRSAAGRRRVRAQRATGRATRKGPRKAAAAARERGAPLIVFVTWSPSSMAPPNSVNTAMQHAAFSVSEPEPTLVANEFATSLEPAAGASGAARACWRCRAAAPMPNASAAAKTKPRTKTCVNACGGMLRSVSPTAVAAAAMAPRAARAPRRAAGQRREGASVLVMFVGSLVAVCMPAVSQSRALVAALFALRAAQTPEVRVGSVVLLGCSLPAQAAGCTPAHQPSRAASARLLIVTVVPYSRPLAGHHLPPRMRRTSARTNAAAAATSARDSTRTAVAAAAR